MSRKIDVSLITAKVAELFARANTELRPDVLEALRELYEKESIPNAKSMLGVLVENAGMAGKEKIAICQDTGISVVFLEIGMDVRLSGGSLKEAVDRGVEKAYSDNFFRMSVVPDPVLRENTGGNTPAVVHTDIVEGDGIAITVMPKGFGSENKGKIAMMNPTSRPEDIVAFCVGAVRDAGPDACPPYALGIGVGGTMETCALAAKKALLRPVSSVNPAPHLARLEKEIKQKTNSLGIGVMGLGGGSTVMGVCVEALPTHIAGLPVAVNVSCHALRSASGEI
ncbi:MAG: fumarate hydratase [Candidatus Omnitrophica bacterium]|nr:fumarate hydratase [Candidatus Omnitrophota bacterium]